MSDPASDNTPLVIHNIQRIPSELLSFDRNIYDKTDRIAASRGFVQSLRFEANGSYKIVVFQYT
jgi:hypothetical protein